MEEFYQKVLKLTRDFAMNNRKNPKFLIVSVKTRQEIIATAKNSNTYYRSLEDHEMYAGLILTTVAPWIDDFIEVA